MPSGHACSLLQRPPQLLTHSRHHGWKSMADATGIGRAPAVRNDVCWDCPIHLGAQPTTMKPPDDATLRETVRLRMSPQSRESVTQIARDTGSQRRPSTTGAASDRSRASWCLRRSGHRSSGALLKSWHPPQGLRSHAQPGLLADHCSWIPGSRGVHLRGPPPRMWGSRRRVTTPVDRAPPAARG